MNPWPQLITLQNFIQSIRAKSILEAIVFGAKPSPLFLPLFAFASRTILPTKVGSAGLWVY